MAKATSHISEVEKELGVIKGQHMQVRNPTRPQKMKRTCDRYSHDSARLLSAVRHGERGQPPASQSHVGQHAEG